MSDKWETVPISDFAKLTINPLRKLKFEQTVEPNPDKRVITLQLGDPSIFGNFPPAKG
jgi:tyrosine aminotransferase